MRGVEFSDAQLLVRTSRGDQAAARLIWQRHGPALCAYARAILGSGCAHQADDVVQSVMCSILKTPVRKLATVIDGRLWLATLARRRCLNVLRSAGRESRRLARLASQSRAVGTPDAVPAGELSPRLLAALDRLPLRHREIIVLKHISSLTFDQIALSLNKNRSTLASQYHAAMNSLREQIDLQDRTMNDGHAAQPAVQPSQGDPMTAWEARTSRT